MTQTDIVKKLKSILNKMDIDDRDILNRQKDCNYKSEIDMLLDHLSIVVSYLVFENNAIKKDIIDICDLDIRSHDGRDEQNL